MFVPAAIETAWAAFGDGNRHDFDGPRPRGSIMLFWAWGAFSAGFAVVVTRISDICFLRSDYLPDRHVDGAFGA